MIAHKVKKIQISKQPSIKTQILLAHTSSTLDEYFTKISTRWNGEYDAVFTYTIGKNGSIYEHFNALHYSNLFGVQEIDSQIISIGLENHGWVSQKSPEMNITWKGNIYKGQVFEKTWRGHNFWEPYTPEQIESLLNLTKALINEFHIKPEFSGSNLPMDGAKEFKGVLNRGNYFKYYYDLSPAADFDYIKNSIKKFK